MSAIFKPALIVALLFLAASAQYFIYAAYVAPREQTTRDLANLTDVLQLEAKKKPDRPAAENRGATVPDLLTRVQELAVQNAVTLVGMELLPGDGEQFKLSLSAGYGNFLGFLARFETLQVEITGFEMAPAGMPDALAISLIFSHATQPNAIQSERIKTFMMRLKDSTLRDPFDPGNAMVQIAADSNGDDLSLRFHLTSISEIGKAKYATIDGKDYNVGDELKGFVIGAIGSDTVTLVGNEDGKPRRRFLTFRNLGKDRT